MKKLTMDARKTHQIFLEKNLWEMARLLSKKYTKMGIPICGKADGSASWYIRNALLERMKKESVKLDLLNLTDCNIYNIQG